MRCIQRGMVWSRIAILAMFRNGSGLPWSRASLKHSWQVTTVLPYKSTPCAHSDKYELIHRELHISNCPFEVCRKWFRLGSMIGVGSGRSRGTPATRPASRHVLNLDTFIGQRGRHLSRQNLRYSAVVVFCRLYSSRPDYQTPEQEAEGFTSCCCVTLAKFLAADLALAAAVDLHPII